jgi:hypothetical protein
MMPMTITEARSTIERVMRPVGLIRVSEAATIAGVSVETLNRRIRRGLLHAWGCPRRVCLDQILTPFVPASDKNVA